MRIRRNPFLRSATSDKMRGKHRVVDNEPGYWNRRQRILAIITAPLLAIGLAAGGVTLPAYAGDAAPDATTQSTDVATPSSTPSDTATPSDAPSPAVSPSASSTPSSDPSSTPETSQTATLPTQAKVQSLAARPLADAATTTIVVNAGGVRTSNSAVNGLAGAVYQAVPTDGSATVTCTMPASGNSCSMSVPGGKKWKVSAQTAAGGFYLSSNLDSGTSDVGTAKPYVFATNTVAAGATITVPGTTLNSEYQDQNSQYFSGELAQSLLNPAVSQKCGLKIALVLDQSGSMAGTKQTNLKSAANEVITDLTGTPSTLAIYTFSSNIGGGQAATSTATTTTAAPLRNFVDALGSPGGSTNWDRGLSQVGAGYDLVILLTDGNPTVYGNNQGDGGNSHFAYVEQGVFSANMIKARGERLVAVGIGVNGGDLNLRAVSGPTPGVDYFPSSIGGFGDTLKQLATGSCNNTITVTKQIENASGAILPNSPLANGWNFAGTSGVFGAFPATAAMGSPATNGVSQTSVSIPGGSTPQVSVQETTNDPAYTFDASMTKCTVGGQPATGVSVDAASKKITFTAAANVPIACTFTNKQIPTYTVTVKKVWTNSVAGDQANITLTGTNGGTATAPSTNNNVVTGTYPAGTAIKVAETLAAGNKGAYSGSLSCDTTPVNTNGSFTMPSKNVTCTFTNVNATHTVKLQKTWINGVDKDTAALRVNGDSSTAKTSTANGAASFTDTVNTVTELNVPVGSTVGIAETLGSSNKGAYGSAWSCPSATPTSGSGVSGSFRMPDADVTCTITNTNGSAAVNVLKNWSGAIGDDVSTIAVDGPNSGHDSHNSIVPAAGGTYNDPTPATLTVPIGSTVTVSETMANNDGKYTTTLKCAGTTVTTTDSGATKSYTFTVTANTTCTFTNSNGTAPITLSKLWDTSIASDTAGLAITGNGLTGAQGATAVANGTAGQVSSQQATANAALGSTVTLGETLPAAGHTNQGTYSTVGYTCTYGANHTPITLDGTTFKVPKDATSVNCQVENALSTASVTVKKVWTNAIGGDTTTVFLDGTPYNNLSTVNGPVGGFVDSQTDVLVNAQPVPVGTTIGVHETLGTNNAGSYNHTEKCVDKDGNTVTKVVAGGVTCTVTNTSKLAMVILNKEWKGGVKGDSTMLKIAPAAAFGPTVTGTSTVTTNGQTDTTPVDAIQSSVTSGGSVNVSEVLNGTNLAGYDQALTCSGATVSGGTFTVPKDVLTVTCTFVNTVKQTTVTLKKNWQGGVQGDSAALRLNATTKATSTYTGTNGVDGTNVASLAVNQGTPVTFNELLTAAGTYSATIDCGTGPHSLNIGGYTLTVGKAPIDCVITNTQNSHTVTVVKKWVDSISGDSTNLTINGGHSATATTSGGTVTSAQEATASIGAGSGVTVAESTPGPKGSYSKQLVCDGATANADGHFTMPDSDVTCTFTNTNAKVNVVLQKAWVNAAPGDKTTLSLWSQSNGTDNQQVTAPNTTPTASWQVPVGTNMLADETLFDNNKAGYTSQLMCDSGITPNGQGDFAVPTTAVPGSTITCTITNTAKMATVKLYKSWVNGIAGDSAALTISGGTGASGHTSTATGGDQTDNTPATATANTGSTIGLNETLTRPSGVTYTSTLVCKSGDTTLKLGDDGKSVTIPATATAVDCRYTNTAQSGTITLHKVVSNTHGGKAANTDWTLTAGIDGGFSTSGKDGDAAVTKQVAPVGAYTLGEASGPAGYTLSDLQCTNNGTPVQGVGVGTPTFTLGVGDNVVCTFTNQDQPVNLLLNKKVDETQAGGVVTPGQFTLTATPVNIPGQGAVPFKGDATTPVAVFAGAYTLSESGPAGFLSGTWTCTGGSVTDHGDGTATLVVTNGQTASCEITNTAIQPVLTLVKDVASSGNFNGAGQKGDWTLTADGPTPVTGAGDSSSIVDQGVKVGDYDLSEVGDGTFRTEGYTLTDLTCVDNNTKEKIDGVGVDHASVSLVEGDNVTCTFTNTPTPAKWTISKTSDKGLAVMPGDTIDYTITITHVPGTSWPSLPLFSSPQKIDDLSGLADATYVIGSLDATNGATAGLVTSGVGQGVTWNLDSASGVDFTKSFSVSYSYKVNDGAWGKTLRNAVTPPQNFDCVGDNDCTTESETPDLDLWKTSAVSSKADPNNAAQVLPGGTVTYTLHAHNYTDVDLPAGQTETDDLTGVLEHATVNTPLDSALSFDNDHTITWTLPAIAAGDDATVSFTVTVDSADPGPEGADLTNVLVPGTIGNCPSDRAEKSAGDAVEEEPSCTTTTHEPHIDLGITKESSTEGPVDNDPGATSEYYYTLTVTNHSDEAVHASTVSDLLPSQITVDTTKGSSSTPGFERVTTGFGKDGEQVTCPIPAPDTWALTYSAGTNSINIGISGMEKGACGAIKVYVLVKPVVKVGTIVDPGQAGPDPITPPADIDNQACVSIPNDVDSTNDCGSATVPQKAVEANIWVQCRADVPYLHYDIQTTANIADEPVSLLWSANQPGSGGVPATDLPPDPSSISKTLHSGDSGEILWPGGAVNPQGIGIGFPGWRPIQASDYNADGTLKFTGANVFAGLVYDPTTVATDAWRYDSTVSISVNPTATYTVTYPPATAACAVARETQVGFTKTASVTNTTPGGAFTYTLAAHNLNLGAASPVTVKDPIPSDIKVTSIDTDGTAFPRWENCAVTGTDSGGYGGTLNCDLFGPLSLNSPETPAIDLKVSVRPTTTATKIVNTATLCFANMDNTSETGCEDASATVYLNGGLAATGSDAWPWVGFGGGLLALGAMVMGWLWRRRREEGELS